MVYNKMITKLVHLLQEELNVDVPAFYHNQPNAARLDFEEADDPKARNVVKSALQYCAKSKNSGYVHTGMIPESFSKKTIFSTVSRIPL